MVEKVYIHLNRVSHDIEYLKIFFLLATIEFWADHFDTITVICVRKTMPIAMQDVTRNVILRKHYTDGYSEKTIKDIEK